MDLGITAAVSDRVSDRDISDRDILIVRMMIKLYCIALFNAHYPANSKRLRR
jgi:hypothetical protein